MKDLAQFLTIVVIFGYWTFGASMLADGISDLLVKKR